MSIFDYVEESREVPFSKLAGETFKVWPITLENLGVILNEFREEAEELYVQNEEKGNINAYSLIKHYPKLCVTVIAHATREPMDEKLIAQVSGLPLGVQVMALLKIWDLMALDMEELGNVLAELADVLRKISDNLEKNPARPPSVSGKSTSSNTLSA